MNAVLFVSRGREREREMDEVGRSGWGGKERERGGRGGREKERFSRIPFNEMACTSQAKCAHTQN